MSSTKIIYIYLSPFFLTGISFLIYDFWIYAHLVYVVYTTGKIWWVNEHKC
jgi:hypothetical protein